MSLCKQCKIKKRANESGVALISGLVLSLILSLIAFHVITLNKNNVEQIGAIRNKLSAEFELKSVLHNLIYSTLTKSAFTCSGKEFVLSMKNENRINDNTMVQIYNLAGKIALYPTNTQQLKVLATRLAGQEDAEIFINSLGDWQDKDNFPRLNGLEQSGYKFKRSLNSVPRNDDIQSVNELNFINGMTPALFEQLKPHLIFYSTQPFSLRAASDELVQLLVGHEPYESKNNVMNPFNQNGINLQDGSAVDILIEISYDDVRFLRHVQIDFLTNSNTPYSIISWSD